MDSEVAWSHSPSHSLLSSQSVTRRKVKSARNLLPLVAKVHSPQGEGADLDSGSWREKPIASQGALRGRGGGQRRHIWIQPRRRSNTDVLLGCNMYSKTWTLEVSKAVKITTVPVAHKGRSDQ